MCLLVVDLDCIVSEWGIWSSPNQNGISRRTRTVLRQPIGNAGACPDLEETKQGKSKTKNHWVNVKVATILKLETNQSNYFQVIISNFHLPLLYLCSTSEWCIGITLSIHVNIIAIISTLNRLISFKFVMLFYIDVVSEYGCCLIFCMIWGITSLKMGATSCSILMLNLIFKRSIKNLAPLLYHWKWRKLNKDLYLWYNLGLFFFF